ncbi:MAG: hypothetical protein PHU46_01950 [Rhodocyclaceae bacterium]|nr:hypothetical protein [Rhodocyclaceae bacterium]
MHSEGHFAPDEPVPGRAAAYGRDAEVIPSPSGYSSSGRRHRQKNKASQPVAAAQALRSPSSHHSLSHEMRIRNRPRRLGKAKYAWALIGGLLLFLTVFFLLYPPGRREFPHAEHLLGHFLLWPVLLLVVSGLFSLAVVFGFRLGASPVTREAALRDHVGRKLAKLGMVGVMFGTGWLVGLFLALLLAMLQG